MLRYNVWLQELAVPTLMGSQDAVNFTPGRFACTARDLVCTSIPMIGMHRYAV